MNERVLLEDLKSLATKFKSLFKKDKTPKDDELPPQVLKMKKSIPPITQSDVDQVHTFANKVMKKHGIGVDFTRHMVQRAQDDRNIIPVSKGELIAFYTKLDKAISSGKIDLKKYSGKEYVLKNKNTSLNMVVASNKKLLGKDTITSKTLMRKDNYKSYDPIVAFEELVYEVLDQIELIQEGYSPQKHQEGTPASVKYAKGMTPGEKKEKKMKDFHEFRKEVKEAKYQGKEVTLNKPMPGDVKKSKVFVKDGDKVKKVNFGDKNMSIKKDQKGNKASYCARSKGIKGGGTDKTKANYWSRKAWDC